MHAASLLQEALTSPVGVLERQAIELPWRVLVGFCQQKNISLAKVIDQPANGLHPLLSLVQGKQEQALSILAQALAAACSGRRRRASSFTFANGRVGFEIKEDARTCTFGQINAQGQPHGFNIWQNLGSHYNALERWAGEYVSGNPFGAGSATSEVIDLRGALGAGGKIHPAIIVFKTDHGRATFEGSACLRPNLVLTLGEGEWGAVDGSRSYGTLGDPDGKGKTILPNGDSYEGEWRRSREVGAAPIAHGRGLLRDQEGTYEGAFIYGDRDGEGTQRYLDGSVYKGIWRHNRRNGQGKWVQADGTVLIGRFEDGNPIDEMRLLREDGVEGTALFIDGRRVSTTVAAAIANQAGSAATASGARLETIEKELGAAALKILELEAELRATREAAQRAEQRAQQFETLVRAHLSLNAAATIDLMP